MYEVGDLIVYGSMGVCRVEAIGAPPGSAFDPDKSYYTLAPLYKGGHIYAPTDTSIFMRPVISRDRALSLIKRIPDIDESVYENETRQVSLLREHYQSLLRSHDCVDLVHLIKSVYVKRQSLAKNGKSLGQVEAQFMRQAEDALYEELAVALDIPRGDVKAYVEEAVERIKRRVSMAVEAGLTFDEAEPAY